MARSRLASRLDARQWSECENLIPLVRSAGIIIARDLASDHDRMLWGMRHVIAYEEHADLRDPLACVLFGYRGEDSLESLKRLVRHVKGRRCTRVDLEAMELGWNFEDFIDAVDRRDATRWPGWHASPE